MLSIRRKTGKVSTFCTRKCYHESIPLQRLRTTMSSSAPASALGFRDVLKNSSVKRLWIAQIVSIFGDFLAVFAVISVVTFQLHGTPTQVSMILAAYMAPLAIISPLAG